MGGLAPRTDARFDSPQHPQPPKSSHPIFDELPELLAPPKPGPGLKTDPLEQRIPGVIAEFPPEAERRRPALPVPQSGSRWPDGRVGTPDFAPPLPPLPLPERHRQRYEQVLLAAIQPPPAPDASPPPPERLHKAVFPAAAGAGTASVAVPGAAVQQNQPRIDAEKAADDFAAVFRFLTEPNAIVTALVNDPGLRLRLYKALTGQRDEASPMDAADPLPPLPGFEPEAPQDDGIETFPIPEAHGPQHTGHPIPEPQKPDVEGYPDKSDENSLLIFTAEGLATKRFNEQIAEVFIRAGWKHIHGGKHKDGTVKKEVRIPGPAGAFMNPKTGRYHDGRKGSHWIDMAFEKGDDVILVQTVDVDPKTGKATNREQENAERIFIRRYGVRVDGMRIFEGKKVSLITILKPHQSKNTDGHLTKEDKKFLEGFMRSIL